MNARHTALLAHRGVRRLGMVILLAGACTPGIVHTSIQHEYGDIQIVQRDGRHWVTYRGVQHTPVRDIALQAITVSSDGEHIAYPARIGRKWSVVVDGIAGPQWDGIADLLFTPDNRRVVYVAARAKKWVVVDGSTTLDEPVDAIMRGTLTVSASGRVAYVLSDRGFFHVIIDGARGPAFDGVRMLTFDSSGERAAYVGRRADAAFLVSNGIPSPALEGIAEYVWTNAALPYYLGRRSDGWYAMAGGRTLGPYEAVSSLRATPDGRTWVFMARSNGGDVIVRETGSEHVPGTILPATVTLHHSGRLGYVVTTPAGSVAVVDGRASETYTEIRDLQFNANGSHAAYIAVGPHGERVVVGADASDSYVKVADLLLRTNGDPAFVALEGATSSVVFAAGHLVSMSLSRGVSFCRTTSCTGRCWRVNATRRS